MRGDCQSSESTSASQRLSREAELAGGAWRPAPALPLAPKDIPSAQELDMDHAPRTRSEGDLLRWRSVLQALVVGLALAPATGCMRPAQIELRFTRPIELNPKLRPDREGLSAEQMLAAAHSGPYRDGIDPASCDLATEGCEIIAPVTPALVEPFRLENLLQSACLWIGDPQAQANTSDVEAMSVSWEFVAEVQREGMHLACDSPTRFGLCRLRHPETGAPISFQPLQQAFRACPEAEPPMVDSMMLDFGGGLDVLPLQAHSGGGPFVVEDDLFVATTPLVAEFVERGPADPYRRCPGSAETPVPFSGAQAVAVTPSGERGCSGASGSVSACALGCAVFAPAGDNALRLRDTSSGQQRWLPPNLMTVKASSSIARTLAPVAADPTLRAWSTGVWSAGTSVRWHENFSPNLTLDSVRVFSPGPNDAASSDDLAPALAVNPALGHDASGNGRYGITVSGRYRKVDAEKTFEFDCPASQTTNGWVVALGANHQCVGDQTDVAPVDLTPTYAKQHLTVASFPLTEPLSWRVRVGNGESRPVMIEFRLRALARGSALLLSPPARDLGALVIGESRSGWLELENPGSTTMRITAASLSGAHPGDFRFRLVNAHAPVPLPISIGITPARRVVTLLETGSSAITTDRMLAPAVGPSHLRMVRPERDGKTLSVFGNQLDYFGDSAFHHEVPRPVPYVFAPGTVPLDVLQAYTEAVLPLNLAPGRAMRIAVLARPSAYGVRESELRVEAYPVGNPGQRHTAIAALVAEGDSGPQPNLLPHTANWGSVGGSGAVRHFLLVNDGDRDLRRARISLGAGTRFRLVPGNASGEVIASGASERLTVRYLPRCGTPGTAERDVLYIDTDAGRLQAELRAMTGC
jgi:hypothetical protein